MQNCLLSLVERLPRSCYHDVKNNSIGGKNKRKTYIDNIRWMTGVIVVNMSDVPRPILFVIMAISGIVRRIPVLGWCVCGIGGGK